MYKIIIDTNIIINATGDDFSYAWKVLDLVIQGKVKAVASEQILRENRFIVERAIKSEKEKQKLEDFLARVEVVPVYKKIRAVKYDPEDDKFVECAAETGADFVISSDSHLLQLENYGQTKILSPQDFWYFYQGRTENEDEGWKEVFRKIF